MLYIGSSDSPESKFWFHPASFVELGGLYTVYYLTPMLQMIT